MLLFMPIARSQLNRAAVVPSLLVGQPADTDSVTAACPMVSSYVAKVLVRHSQLHSAERLSQLLIIYGGPRKNGYKRPRNSEAFPSLATFGRRFVE